MKPETKRGVIRWIAKAFVGALAYAVVIFVAAGRLNWRWGWIFWAILALTLIAHPLLLIPINPDLLAEREKGILDEAVEPWDKQLTTAAGALMFATWITAGLDVRWGWTGSWPNTLHWLGVVGAVAGYGLFMWAMTHNAFFSEGVRIQTERHHEVQKGGPYQWVRHPGYLGAIVASLSAPILLGSLWALIPAVLLALVFILRTAKEDRFLAANLPDYPAFQAQTTYRLLPGIW